MPFPARDLEAKEAPTVDDRDDAATASLRTEDDGGDCLGSFLDLFALSVDDAADAASDGPPPPPDAPRLPRDECFHWDRDADGDADGDADDPPPYPRVDPLPEYSRLLHNDRGQRHRRRRMRRRSRATTATAEEILPEYSRLLHNDRGQRDRRRRRRARMAVAECLLEGERRE